MASSLAADIKSKYDVDSELIPSTGGCFEVTVDGDLVFSKSNQGRFPASGEVLELMEQRG